MSGDHKRRVSITKAQRQTAAGADLISLCQTVTEDGSLSDDEVAALRQWLTHYENADLPARELLFQTIERIVADGKVTPEERIELYQTLETVLPPDVRDLVRNKRKMAEKQESELRRAEREAARALEKEVRRRNTPLESYDFMVAGSKYEGRPEVISRHARAGDAVILARDPSNRFSRNAIEVRLKNAMQIGFVPEEEAVDMARLLDSRHPYEAHIKKVLTGGRWPVPVVVAKVHPKDWEGPGSVSRSKPSRKALQQPEGCGTTLVAVLVVIALVLFLAFV